MVLASVTQSEEDDVNIQIQHAPDNKVSEDFLAGIGDVDIPTFEFPVSQINGGFEVSSNLVDGPDLPKNLAEAIPTTNSVIESLAPAVPVTVSKEELRKALDLAMDSGLDPKICELINNFCENGLNNQDGIMLAGYALNGIPLKQITNLALMHLGGRSKAEIQQQADAILSNIPGTHIGLTSGAGAGISSAASSAVSSYDQKSAAGVSRLIGRTLFDVPKGIVSGFVGAYKRRMEGKINSDMQRDSVLIVDPIETINGSVSQIESLLLKYKEAETDKKEAALVNFKEGLASFSDSIKRSLGSAKSVEEATSIMGLIKSAKSKLIDQGIEVLPKEESQGLKEFFKLFDAQIKKMYTLIKSKFTSDDKLNALVGDESSSSSKSESGLSPT